MLVQAFYNVVDSVFVAQLSEDSFVALSLVYPIQTLMISICVGVGVGYNALLARRLGIRPGHIYCIGDNQNDIPMLAVSAIPFAPSNCAPEVRAWGARILGSCEESCVAQAIRILDELY